MSRRGGGGGGAGFTLIELLVSLVILALMLSAMGMIVVGTLETDRRLKATLFEQRVGAAILELISRDVQACYAYGFRSALRVRDDGSADTLQLLSTREPASSASTDEGAEDEGGGGIFGGLFGDEPAAGPSAPEPMRLTKVSYFVRESQSHPGFLALLRAEQPYAGELPGQVGPPGQLAAASAPSGGAGSGARGAGAVRRRAASGPVVFGDRLDLDEARVFEVYAKVRGFDVQCLDAEGNWQESWNDPDRLPVAIRVAVEIAPDPRTAERREQRGREPTRRFETVIALPVALP